MKLIGSTTSPFVRRIRLLLADRPYEFVNLDIYGSGRDQLRQSTPVLKIPMLRDGEQNLFDSRVIARYLSQKFNLEPLSWDAENLLTLIDGVNDSAVFLLLSKRSGLNVDEDRMIFNLQRERIGLSLAQLNERVGAGQFESWNYPAICLYCLLDWLDFRDLARLADYPNLQQFRDRHQQDVWVRQTDPRQA